MTFSTNRADLILPKINDALENAGLLPAHIEKDDSNLRTLCFGSGEKYHIRQMGTVMASTLRTFLESMQPEPCIVLFSFISDAMACELSRRNICYADTAGNMFVHHKGGIIHIRNCAKPREVKEAPAAGRCFTPTGLEVLFLLLTKPDALQWNYRTIAEQSGVCLGSVRYIMADLVNKRFVLVSGRKRNWADIRLLRRLWVENYPLRLLPKIKTLRYAGSLTNVPDDKSLVRSGESVAMEEKLLSTENVLLWKQDDNISQTILANRLHQDENGNIEIREAFWPTKIRRYARQVPWLLVYADLLATGDGRCIETADEIRKRHMAGEL